MVRTALATLVATACVLSLAACTSDGPGTATDTPTASTSPTTAGPTPTEPAVPPYLADFSEEERNAYQAAVEDYEEFSRQNAALYRVGEATPAARAFYKKSTAAWQSYWARLQGFESRGIRVLGRAEVIRIRPADVRLGEADGGEVEFRVCSVATDVRVLQNGEPVPQPSPRPTITRVAMVKLPAESSWRILSDRVGGRC